MISTPKRILVIDDEDSICLGFERFFAKRGWDVHVAGTAALGKDLFERTRPDVVFLDVRLPDRSGLDLLDDLAEQQANVIIITAFGGLQTVVRALEAKAYDYLPKPVDLDAAFGLAERILAERTSVPQTISPAQGDDLLLVGNSAVMQHVYKMLIRIAGTSATVLIDGETGTGKDLAARTIHQFSARRDGPLVTLNCGAIPEALIESELFGHVRGAFTGAQANRRGKFHAAHGGTLFLDEIGELPHHLQAKLLHVLETNQVEQVGSSSPESLDVRIVAATNRDLQAEVQAGRFRRDLFHRLAVLQLTMPPLRDREGDIRLLAGHFLQQAAHQQGRAYQFTEACLDALDRAPWPGNVRELKNAIYHAVTVAPSGSLTVGDLPADLHTTPVVGGEAELDHLLERLLASPGAEASADGTERYGRIMNRVERALIVHALRQCGKKQSRAADYLGIHRNTLRNKLRELGIYTKEL